MASVTYEHVYKRFGDVVAVNDLNIEIVDKEFLVLVGPSGCGKTTALRCLAGLEDVTEGRILIDHQVVNDVAPKDRDIAMVFQSYALYPHMSVFDNMAFGLKLRKTPKPEIKRRVEEAARILGIEQLLDRKPRQLSGGQRQRVAVGRAIVREPKVFLFDEPLSNLDAKLRVETRANISKLHQQLETTFIYVTHDQVEAMTMGDRIVVMKDGFIQQVNDPITLYENPANKFVAGFIGSPPMNFMEGQIVKRENGAFCFREEHFQVKIIEDMYERISPYEGKKVVFGIRPEDIYDKLFVGDASPDNTITATVEVIEPMGAETYLYLNTNKHPFIARVDAHEKVEVNQKLEVVFNMSKVHFFDPATEKAIV